MSTTITLESPGIAGLTGRGVGIAVIDSGVHAGHPHIGAIAGGIGIDADGHGHADFVDRLGHGTAVTAAIQEKAPDAAIHVAKVFDRTLATSAGALASAIEWAAGRGVRLVNLSLGTANPARAAVLAEAVSAAARIGTLLVSAAHHEGARWYPGCQPEVIGVELDWDCPRDALRVVDGRLHASGHPRPIPGVPPDRNLRGISFAVANATGFLARVLEREPGAQTAREVLRALDAAGHAG